VGGSRSDKQLTVLEVVIHLDIVFQSDDVLVRSYE
jgi:hypothetical protein